MSVCLLGNLEKKEGVASAKHHILVVPQPAQLQYYPITMSKEESQRKNRKHNKSNPGFPKLSAKTDLRTAL